MKLVYEATGLPVKVGDKVVLPFGTVRTHTKRTVTVSRIVEPHKPVPWSGGVEVKVEGSDDVHEYYPSVIGAHWIERKDRD